MKNRLYQYETVWRASKRRERSKTMSTDIAVLYDLWTLFFTILGYLIALVINLIKGIEYSNENKDHSSTNQHLEQLFQTFGNVELLH